MTDIAVAWSSVSSTGRPTFRTSDAVIAARTVPVALVRRRDGDRPAPAALAAPADHADLDREQLVERQPPERAIARLERRREVGLLDRLADPRQLDPLPDVRGQILREPAAAAVERLADGRPQAGTFRPAVSR